mgnify:FL=1
MTEQKKVAQELLKNSPEYKEVEEAQKEVFQATARFQAFREMLRGNMSVKISLR